VGHLNTVDICIDHRGLGRVVLAAVDPGFTRPPRNRLRPMIHRGCCGILANKSGSPRTRVWLLPLAALAPARRLAGPSLHLAGRGRRCYFVGCGLYFALFFFSGGPGGTTAGCCRRTGTTGAGGARWPRCALSGPCWWSAEASDTRGANRVARRRIRTPAGRGVLDNGYESTSPRGVRRSEGYSLVFSRTLRWMCAEI